MYELYTISFDDTRYPQCLRTIAQPPSLLYIRGMLPPPDATHLAVVGTRKTTPYGKEITERLTMAAAQAGAVIVSGLALGVDGIAHAAALKVGGQTIAVLGSGIDDNSIYPRANYKLAQEILQGGGALISEQQPGTKPMQYHFPQRNRIIAGLSQAVLVTEGTFKSGSLITAKLALEQGRDVFACPHNIFTPRGEGPNYLIQQGAYPVCSAQDLLDALHLTAPTRRVMPTTHTAPTKQTTLATHLRTGLEQKILDACTEESCTIEQLVEKLNCSPAELYAAVSMLELDGSVHIMNGVVLVTR